MGLSVKNLSGEGEQSRGQSEGNFLDGTYHKSSWCFLSLEDLRQCKSNPRYRIVYLLRLTSIPIFLASLLVIFFCTRYKFSIVMHRLATNRLSPFPCAARRIGLKHLEVLHSAETAGC